MHRIIVLALTLLIGGWLQAQQFGGHPTRTTWNQINTDTVRVIFPEGYRQQAAAIAGMAHRIGLQTTSTLGQDFHKISIVLQPRTTISNGYVGLGPWRSEFYLTPPQNSFDLGSLSWHRTLTLHEYRHIQQYGNFRKGISKAFYYLFGEQGLELVTSAAVPNYFWEGDAVHQETSLSDQGRGRLPSFYNGYRSLWSARKHYSWMKLRNGSLRDFVPDHYKLGYMLVAYGRQQYGPDIWGKVTNDAVRYKGLFYPWQHAIKKETGVDYKTFRRDALQYFRSNLAASSKDSSVDQWAQQHRHFAANEEYPQWIDDQTLVYVRSSYQKVPAFYQKNVYGGQEDKLRIKDISLDNYFSYRNGKIVYAGYEVNSRWRWYDYSVIKWFDMASRQHRTLTHKSHYFSPDISEDGNRIVAVEVVPGKPASLQLLNAADGAVIKKLPNPDQLLYTYPKFYGNDQVLTAVRNGKGAMSLCLINTNDGKAEYLLPFSMNVIGFPTVHKDTISFSASWQGQDRLFLLTNKKLYLFTPPASTATTGHYQLQVAHGRFAWSAFTAVGDHLEQGELKAEQLTDIKAEAFATPLPVFGVNEMANQAQQGEDAIPADSLYPVTGYSKGFRLFNFHSWRPIVDDPDYTISLIGQNVLNTMESEIFFNYNRDYKYKQLGASFTYAGLYPWIRLSSVYTMDRLGAYNSKQFHYNTWENTVGVLVPWTFTKGRYNRSLTIGTDLVYSARHYPKPFKDSISNANVAYIRPYISFSNAITAARRHIYSHFAQSISLQYKYAVSDLEAQQFEANANWYFPGILPDHSIIINTAFHARDTMYAGAVYGTSFPFARGYPAQNAYRMSKIGFNYHFALLYPDWGVANTIYFMRVRTNLFYDMVRLTDFAPTSNGGRQKFSVDLGSYGAEMFFDTKWWNQHNVTFGFRYSHLLDADKFRTPPPVNKWEFIVPINLLGRN
ncbi:hypothetical protein [Paraflavitalea sp. CAU 1676]|uniref:hypothetical protein n=1 Tax=Paraflavitalea sp. CAU 1676 TaxID=3032598 RepID=UPI0023DC2AAB|nr:hypothetical protein [Paraflavitalea sp. CAU 1676]MDF2188781.1 hypothetical protein [Paraflavitalea sp. CAU 1676]